MQCHEVDSFPALCIAKWMPWRLLQQNAIDLFWNSIGHRKTSGLSGEGTPRPSKPSNRRVQLVLSSSGFQPQDLDGRKITGKMPPTKTTICVTDWARKMTWCASPILPNLGWTIYHKIPGFDHLWPQKWKFPLSLPCEAPQRCLLVRFAPVTSSLFAYHKPVREIGVISSPQLLAIVARVLTTCNHGYMGYINI